MVFFYCETQYTIRFGRHHTRSFNLTVRNPNVLCTEFFYYTFFWWRMTGSNRRPPACKAGALPAELIPQKGHTLQPTFLPTSMLLLSLYPTLRQLSTQDSYAGPRLVGLVGLEPTTPALSRRCSNQLSYRPNRSLPYSTTTLLFSLFLLFF